MSGQTERGLLDTSVVIALDRVDAETLPVTYGVSSITLAELAAGPAVAGTEDARAKRQTRLQEIEASVEVITFDAASARAYGRVVGAVSAKGRKPRGGRAVDLFIAATALAKGLPLYTLNPDDLDGLQDMIDIVVPRQAR